MKKLFKRLILSSFFKGGIYLSMSNILIGFINYLFNITSGRLLGPANFGDLNALFSYLSLLSTPLAAIGVVLVQKIGKQEDQHAYIAAVERWVLKNMKKYWIIIPISIGIMPFVGSITKLSPVSSYALIPLVYINIFTMLYESFLVGLHIFSWYSLLSTISVLVKLLGVFGGYVIPFPLLMVVIGFDLSLIIKIIIGKYVVQKEYLKSKSKKHIEIDKSLIKTLLDKQLLMTLGSLLSMILFSTADMIFAKHRFTAQEAGLFAAWLVFAKVIMFFFTPLISLSYTFFSSLRHKQNHRLFLALVMIGLTIVGIVTNLIYGLFDRKLIEMLFGREYLSLKPFIEWASLFGTGTVMVQFINYYFLAKQKRGSWILPSMAPLYLVALFWYPQNIGDLIFLNTFFIFFVLFVHLLYLAKGRVDHLISIFKSD